MTLASDIPILFESASAAVIATIDITERDCNGQTALHLLVENPMNYTLPIAESMIPIVRTLLSRGADRHAVDNRGVKPVDLVEAWAPGCVPERDRSTVLSILGSLRTERSRANLVWWAGSQ